MFYSVNSSHASIDTSVPYTVFFPVNGGWSLWSEYSPCSVTCGSGTKVRMRTCTNPIPENNGAECTGVRVETQSCDMGPCSGKR